MSANWYALRNAKIYQAHINGTDARDIALRWLLEVSTVRDIIRAAQAERRARENNRQS